MLQKFTQYLENNGYVAKLVGSNDHSFTAVLTSFKAPKLEHFTQIIKFKDGSFAVRLAFVDVDTIASGLESKVLQSYTLAKNETVNCIENFEGYSYKVYAVYVNGQYDRKIKIAKY